MESHIRLAPTEARNACELAICCAGESEVAKPGTVEALVAHRLPVSENNAILSCASGGTNGIGACSSAEVVQSMLPLRFSIVVPGVMSRGPKPLGAKLRMSCGPP